ncbi:MAG: 2-oxo acid dehydrogenase subunit E2 [Chloroflexi bacterium]|nr:2-oxo acid dehydrogenase subunit E2 [Chloroflexota bacterium]
MKNQHDGYTVVPFSNERQMVSDILDLGHGKHLVHGLVEVDVTKSRQYIRDYEAATGTDISFTAFIATCLGKAVEMNKHVHAYRSGGKKLIQFDDVDVSTMIEIEMDGKKFPIAHIIRAANKKTYQDINRDIQKTQAEGAKSQSAPTSGMRKVFLALPPFVRRFWLGRTFGNPHGQKRFGGTVLLTSVGMFSKSGGWGIPFTEHTLSVTLGGIAEKPVVVDGQIEIRELLSVTVSFDHDIVDGAPAARFAQQFTDLIERGYGLVGQDVTPEQNNYYSANAPSPRPGDGLRSK